MKTIRYLFFLLGSCTVAYSQDPLTYNNPHNNSENLNDANNMLVRYWYYRWRLQNDFLIIGDQPGYSIPAEERVGFNTRSVRWGDGTIWLGNYLVMLATENALIRYSNRYYDLLKNERELYYAMQAFNRLDITNDTYYDAGMSNEGSGTPMPACKNGFFIRDDVPAKFFTSNYMDGYPVFDINNPSTWATTLEFDHFTNGKSGFDYIWKPFTANSSGALGKDGDAINNNIGDGNDYIVPDYNNPYIPISHNDKEAMKAANTQDHKLYFSMSQDQIYRLLSGFAAVIRTIPAGATMVDTDNDGNGDTPFDFSEEAKIHCTNIIARLYGMSSNTHDNNTFAPCSLLFPGFNWLSFDPLAESPGAGDYSGTLAPMASKIWQMYYSTNNNIPGLTQNYVDFVKIASNSPISPFLIISALSEGIGMLDNVNAKLYLYTELVSGAYPIWYGFIGGDMIYNQNRVINHLYNHTTGQNDGGRNWNTYMLPLYCYLHNASPTNNTAITNWTQTRTAMFSQLRVAPCIGPYNKLGLNDGVLEPDPFFLQNYGTDKPVTGVNGWSTAFRFDQTNESAYNGFGLDKHGNKVIENFGFFNGIDYMSELNLFYITSNTYTSQPTSLPFYQNLIDRYVDYDVSSDNTPMLGAFNTMSIHNSITGSGQLDIQAGSSIHLQDGTHITASQPSKHLFIKTFSCTDFNQNGSYELPQVTDSTLQVIKVLRPMNNDYGFNEVFPIMKYNVHPYLDNTPNTLEINQNMSNYNLNQSNTSDSIVLYPNPTENFFSIKNIENRKTVVCSIQIISMDGKIIQTEQIREKYDISELAPGTYIVHLQFPSGDVSDKKLIILP